MLRILRKDSEFVGYSLGVCCLLFFEILVELLDAVAVQEFDVHAGVLNISVARHDVAIDDFLQILKTLITYNQLGAD